MSIKEGRKRLAIIEKCMEASIRRFEVYIKKLSERLIIMASKSTDNIKANRTRITRKWGKINVWALQVTNRRNPTGEDLEMVTKAKP